MSPRNPASTFPLVRVEPKGIFANLHLAGYCGVRGLLITAGKQVI